MKARRDALCPSAPAAPGAELVGVIEPGGRVVNLPTPLAIDENFVESARGAAPLEARFRFSSACAEGRCGYWAGTQCGLIDRLTQSIAAEAAEGLPACAIRSRCRWWQQRGRDACAICSYVVTGTPAMSGGQINRVAPTPIHGD